MTTITDYYGISGPVPFVDVDVDDDNEIFVDPYAIRLTSGTEPHRSLAVRCVDTFMRRVTDLILAGRTSEARRLLRSFKEPWETRMGYSKAGYFGHGSAQQLGDALCDELTGNLIALLRIGVLRQIERIPAFVGGIAEDITSDITARIIYASLVSFTREVMAKYPSLRASAVMHRARLWDVASQEWVERDVVLPAPHGKPLLLVPNGWARRNHLITAHRYYGVAVIGHVQLKEAAYSPQTGKLIKTPKDELKKRDDLKVVVPTNVRITLEADDAGQDLFADYEEHIREWLQKAEKDNWGL